MPLHFELPEYQSRMDRVQAALAQDGLDGILLFSQANMYWLTGYDTFGFCFFQCLYLGADGRLALLCRSADRLQALQTSIIEDLHVWKDGETARPAEDLKTMLSGLGLSGKKLGIEYGAHGLTALHGRAVDTALEGFCSLSDASLMLDKLRVVKSADEIDYVRKAAELAEASHVEAIRRISPGISEAEVLAAQHWPIFAGDGDYPANEFIIGSGPQALLCRYQSGRRWLEARDQITLEFAGVYRHYHAAIMHTVLIGEPDPRHLELYAAAEAALHAMASALVPGKTAGDVFAAHADALAGHDMAELKLNACGYALGASFAPSWMEWPMFYEGNRAEIKPNMVFFLHVILPDQAKGLAMTLGRTYLITEDGNEALTGANLGFTVK